QRAESRPRRRVGQSIDGAAAALAGGRSRSPRDHADLASPRGISPHRARAGIETGDRSNRERGPSPEKTGAVKRFFPQKREGKLPAREQQKGRSRKGVRG